MKHIFHEFDITDHASTYFSIDFLPQNKGPGVFRAHPSLLNNKDYKAHIYNVILHTLLDDIKDKTISDCVEWMSILQAKEELEQKNISCIWKKTITGDLGENC